MHVDVHRLGGPVEQPGLASAQKGSAIPDVNHDMLIEKGAFPQPRPVYELAGNHQVQRREFLFQAANGADGYYTLDTEGLQGVDIGPNRYVGRIEAMAPPMSGEKGYPRSCQVAQDDGVAGAAEGRINIHALNVGGGRLCHTGRCRQ